MRREVVIIDSNHDALICPSCGGINLHHDSVDMYFRNEEDSSDGKFIGVDKTNIIRSDDISDNPSPRRDGLFVNFSCETCDADLSLEIIQHKGSTYMEWDVNKKSKIIRNRR